MVPSTLDAQPRQSAQATMSVCFVPPDDCSGSLIEVIGAARTRIRVIAYELTARPIIAALIDAHPRGVDVKAVLDRTNARTIRDRPGSAVALTEAGISVWIDHPRSIEHNKIMVIDDDLAVGGSFNYSAAAQARNAENMTVTRSAEVAAWYLADWTARKEVSELFRID
jgi:phosphatidylserine/phosphatidylglycerophosphate/cardiolipin synthase-like enzyme